MASTVSTIEQNLMKQLDQKSVALASFQEKLRAIEMERNALQDQTVPRLEKHVEVTTRELNEERDMRLAAEKRIDIINSRAMAEVKAAREMLDCEQNRVTKLEKRLQTDQRSEKK